MADDSYLINTIVSGKIDDIIHARRDETLHARQNESSSSHMDFNGRSDHNIATTQADRCCHGHSDISTHVKTRELTSTDLKDYINSVSCHDDSFTNTKHVSENITSSSHPDDTNFSPDDIHTNVNPDDTTHKVQQDIEHFKEQYLHSLTQSLPRRPHPCLQSTFLRRDSLPCPSTSSSEDISRASPSSDLGRERSFSPVSVDHASRQSSSPGFVLTGHLLARRHSCVSMRTETEDLASVSPSSPVAKDGMDREKFKEAYLNSLCLTQRSPRARGLPVLKTRISQFELWTKSPPQLPAAGQTSYMNTSGSGIRDQGPVHSSHIRGQSSVKHFSDVIVKTSDKTKHGNSDNVKQDDSSMDSQENVVLNVKGNRYKTNKLTELIVKNNINHGDSPLTLDVVYPQTPPSPPVVYSQELFSPSMAYLQGPPIPSVAYPQASSSPATTSPVCSTTSIDSTNSIESTARSTSGYRPPVPPKPKLSTWLKKKLFAKVEAQHLTHNGQGLTTRVKPGLSHPPISHPGHVLRRSLSAPIHGQCLHHSSSGHTPLVDFESTGACVTPRGTDSHVVTDDVDGLPTLGTFHWTSMDQPELCSDNPIRFRVKDFRIPSSAISKAYTDEEKAFIQESLRQSGCRRVRSQSLESSVDMDASGVDITVKPARPTPSKLSKSFTNIIKLFEPAEVKVPKVLGITSPPAKSHRISPDTFQDIKVESTCPGLELRSSVSKEKDVAVYVDIMKHPLQLHDRIHEDANNDAVSEQSEISFDTSIHNDQASPRTAEVFLDHERRSLKMGNYDERYLNDSLNISSCDRRLDFVEQNFFDRSLSNNVRSTSEMSTADTFHDSTLSIVVKVGAPQIHTGAEFLNEAVLNEAVSNKVVSDRELKNISKSADPDRVIFTERSEGFIQTQTPPGISRQLSTKLCPHRSLSEDWLSCSQPDNYISYCRSVEKFASLFAKSLFAESVDAVINIIKRRRENQLLLLKTSSKDRYKIGRKNVVYGQSSLIEMDDVISGSEPRPGLRDNLLTRCPGMTNNSLLTTDLGVGHAEGKEGQINDNRGVSVGHFADPSDVSDNEVIDRQTPIESGAFVVRKSYSDISGSVESFYSGYSESLDSFQSADDVLLEQSRELCGTTSRNEGLAEDNGQLLEIEIPPMDGNSGQPLEIDMVGYNGQQLGIDLPSMDVDRCTGRMMDGEKENNHNVEDACSQEMLGLKTRDNTTGSHNTTDIWTSSEITGSNNMTDIWTTSDVWDEMIATEAGHGDLGESDAISCFVARDLGGQTETEEERCPLATSLDEVEFEDCFDERNMELRCTKSPEENSSGFVSDVSEISDVTCEPVIVARGCDSETFNRSEVKPLNGQCLHGSKRIKLSGQSAFDPQDVNTLEAKDRNRNSGPLNDPVAEVRIGQEMDGEAEDEGLSTRFLNNMEDIGEKVGLSMTSLVSEIIDEKKISICNEGHLVDDDTRQHNEKISDWDKCDNAEISEMEDAMTDDDISMRDDVIVDQTLEWNEVSVGQDVHRDHVNTDTPVAVALAAGADPMDRRHGGSGGVVRWAQSMEVYEEYDNVDGDESSCEYLPGPQGQQGHSVESQEPLYTFEPEYQLLETIFERDEEDESSSGECVCGADGSAFRVGGLCPKCHVSIKVYDENDHEISSNDVDYTLSTSESSDSDLGVASRGHSKGKYESDGSCESMDMDSLDEEDSDAHKVDVERPRIEHCVEERQTLERARSSSSLPIKPPCSSDYFYQQETQNESPPLSSHSFMLDDTPDLEDNFHNSRYKNTNSPQPSAQRSMTLSKVQPREETQKSKVKEKLWKEAEDVGGSPSGLRSPQKSQPAFHLDLASVDMTQMSSGDNLLESPSSSLHRISSASTFQHSEGDSGRLHDPYRMLERSQSDASLIKRDNELLADADEVHLTAAESSSGQNISECNRVYLDLSRAEAFERVELGESSGSMMRTSSGRLLETIPQDEELKTGDLSYVYASRRSFSQESSSSMEDLSYSSKCKSKDVSKIKTKTLTTTTTTTGDSSSLSSKSNLRSSFQIYSQSLKQKVRQLQMGSIPEQLNALTELNVLMEQAWSMPIYGKDLAYELCDILRTDSALDIIVNNLASSNRELMKVSARLLEQSLTTSNRRQISENGLELVVKMTHDARGDCELAQTCTGILESLFKTSEDTCAKVIKLGGLDTITYWCRCNDRVTLKNCAIALSNLALYGGGENQQEMAKHKVPEWLFPLAFVEDDSVRYYALLAIGVLVSNKEIENAVMSSGTLALVLPFIDSHDPAEFAQRDMSHRHGRSPGWLKRLIPVLSSKREEAQALAAFHFVMEAGIKSEQGRKEVLYKIGAVEPLKWLASTPNRVASRLAAQALKIIGEEVPHKLSQQVPLWTCDDVVHWIGQGGFSAYTEKFQLCQVDGDLLLRLTEEELRDSLDMTCAISRKRFLRELRDLKISSDYTSCDPSMLGAWLRDVGEDMSQYTYQMLYTGVDRPLLRSIKDAHLAQDCNIVNGIHRMKILAKIEELRSSVSSPTSAAYDSVDALSSVSQHKPPIDVFISYRRSNGSQLASLLKVHLQLRGFTVFIDIERLRAGKFDESLLESVKQAKNFIIVLTPNALDRCMGDAEKKDWVHREITAAIESGSNIIPLLDNFKWPSPDTLPEDMRNVCFFNAVRWIHDYQDACVDKLEQFLRGETNPQQRPPVASNSSSASNTSVPRQSTSGFESPNSPPYQRAQGLSKAGSIESPGDT